jgi:hypothetical protein
MRKNSLFSVKWKMFVSALHLFASKQNNRGTLLQGSVTEASLAHKGSDNALSDTDQMKHRRSESVGAMLPPQQARGGPKTAHCPIEHFLFCLIFVYTELYLQEGFFSLHSIAFFVGSFYVQYDSLFIFSMFQSFYIPLFYFQSPRVIFYVQSFYVQSYFT